MSLASRRAAFGADLTDPRHGTVNGYSNLRCRCEPCRQAWRIHHRAYMQANPNRLDAHAEREARRRAAQGHPARINVRGRIPKPARLPVTT